MAGRLPETKAANTTSTSSTSTAGNTHPRHPTPNVAQHAKQAFPHSHSHHKQQFPSAVGKGASAVSTAGAGSRSGIGARAAAVGPAAAAATATSGVVATQQHNTGLSPLVPKSRVSLKSDVPLFADVTEEMRKTKEGKRVFHVVKVRAVAMRRDLRAVAEHAYGTRLSHNATLTVQVSKGRLILWGPRTATRGPVMLVERAIDPGMIVVAAEVPSHSGLLLVLTRRAYAPPGTKPARLTAYSMSVEQSVWDPEGPGKGLRSNKPKQVAVNHIVSLMLDGIINRVLARARDEDSDGGDDTGKDLEDGSESLAETAAGPVDGDDAVADDGIGHNAGGAVEDAAAEGEDAGGSVQDADGADGADGAEKAEKAAEQPQEEGTVEALVGSVLASVLDNVVSGADAEDGEKEQAPEVAEGALASPAAAAGGLAMLSQASPAKDAGAAGVIVSKRSLPHLPSVASKPKDNDVPGIDVRVKLKIGLKDGVCRLMLTMVEDQNDTYEYHAATREGLAEMFGDVLKPLWHLDTDHDAMCMMPQFTMGLPHNCVITCAGRKVQCWDLAKGTLADVFAKPSKEWTLTAPESDGPVVLLRPSGSDRQRMMMRRASLIVGFQRGSLHLGFFAGQPKNPFSTVVPSLGKAVSTLVGAAYMMPKHAKDFGATDLLLTVQRNGAVALWRVRRKGTCDLLTQTKLEGYGWLEAADIVPGRGRRVMLGTQVGAVLVEVAVTRSPQGFQAHLVASPWQAFTNKAGVNSTAPNNNGGSVCSVLYDAFNNDIVLGSKSGLLTVISLY